MLHYEKMENSARGIGAVYMCFNGTGFWGGETISRHKGSVVLGLFGHISAACWKCAA